MSDLKGEGITTMKVYRKDLRFLKYAFKHYHSNADRFSDLLDELYKRGPDDGI